MRTWPDIDLRKRTLRVRESKSGTGRTIPLSDDTCRLIRGLKSRWVASTSPEAPRISVGQYGQGKGEISAPLPEGKQDPSPPVSPLVLVAGSTYWAFGAK